MTAHIEVEWVGGPRDGERFAMRSYQPTYRVTLPPTLGETQRDDDLYSPTLTTMDVPIRLTRHGYRAYWNEGR